MRLAFLGTGEFGIPALRALLEAGHEIALVISQPDRPRGRGRQLEPSAIHAEAQRHGLRHVQAQDVNVPEIIDQLRSVELGFVVAFGQKLSAETIGAPRLGCVNLHGSVLPRLRGAAPIQWAVLLGERETGVTIFQLNERWDAGEIWLTRTTPIDPRETADELHDRLAIMGAEAATAAVAQVQRGHPRPSPQDPALATRAPKLSKADGWIDFDVPAQNLVRRIHGLWSWPAATCRFVSVSGTAEQVQLARAEALPETTHALPPGTVRDDRTVACGSGVLRILEIKPAGGKLMDFGAFARGRRVAAGDRFERIVDSPAVG